MHLPLSLHLPSSGAGRGKKGKVKAFRKVPVGHLMRNVFALFAHTGSKQTAILAGALRNASLFPAEEQGRCMRERGRERQSENGGLVAAWHSNWVESRNFVAMFVNLWHSLPCHAHAAHFKLDFVRHLKSLTFTRKQLANCYCHSCQCCCFFWPTSRIIAAFAANLVKLRWLFLFPHLSTCLCLISLSCEMWDESMPKQKVFTLSELCECLLHVLPLSLFLSVSHFQAITWRVLAPWGKCSFCNWVWRMFKIRYQVKKICSRRRCCVFGI